MRSEREIGKLFDESEERRFVTKKSTKRVEKKERRKGRKEGRKAVWGMVGLLEFVVVVLSFFLFL